MKKYLSVLLFSGLLAGASALSASSTANVTVTINVLSENDITFSGNPATFNVNPGNSPQTDTTTTYSVITNQSNQRISALIAPALPSGVSLAVNLTAPTGATSLGLVTLTTSSQNLVTGITQLSQSGLGVTYSVSVTPTATVASGIQTVVTYTLST